MLLFDTNILVYATNKDSSFHVPCRESLGVARRDPSPTFLTWGDCYEFLRCDHLPSRTLNHHGLRMRRTAILPTCWRHSDSTC